MPAGRRFSSAFGRRDLSRHVPRLPPPRPKEAKGFAGITVRAKVAADVNTIA